MTDIEPSTGGPADGAPPDGAEPCRFDGPWHDGFLLAVMLTGLVAGIVIGAVYVGEPSKLPEKGDGSLGATILVALAVWAAIDKWQPELTGAGTCALKAVARVLGLLTPMVAVGAAIALALLTLSTRQSGLVAAAIAVICLSLVIAQAWTLGVRLRRAP